MSTTEKNHDLTGRPEAEELVERVRERYGNIAVTGDSCCGGSPAASGNAEAQDISSELGYEKQQLDAVPVGPCRTSPDRPRR